MDQSEMLGAHRELRRMLSANPTEKEGKVTLRHVFSFRSLQQKLGFYSFVLSFLAMVAVSFLTYPVARDQKTNPN
jgi:hypothetical protein